MDCREECNNHNLTKPTSQATNKRKEVPLSKNKEVLVKPRNCQNNINHLLCYWFKKELVYAENAIDKNELNELVSDTLGSSFPTEIVKRYIFENISKEYKVKRKPRDINLQSSSDKEIDPINLIESENFNRKKTTHKQSENDEKLLVSLKQFNGNAKVLLKNIKQLSSINRSFEILLELVEGMAGNFAYFLQLWYENENYKDSLHNFFKEKFVDQKLAIREPAIIDFAREINRHYASISPYLLTLLTVHKYKEVRNLLRYVMMAILPKQTT